MWIQSPGHFHVWKQLKTCKELRFRSQTLSLNTFWVFPRTWGAFFFRPCLSSYIMTCNDEFISARTHCQTLTPSNEMWSFSPIHRLILTDASRVKLHWPCSHVTSPTDKVMLKVETNVSGGGNVVWMCSCSCMNNNDLNCCSCFIIYNYTFSSLVGGRWNKHPDFFAV